MKRRRTIVFIFALCVAITAKALYAQPPRYSVNGSDPVDIRNRVDVNLLDVRGVIVRDIAGFGIAGFAAASSHFGAGLKLPFYYSDFTGWIEGGLGDIILEMRFQAEPSGWHAMYKATAFGAKIHLKTGDYDLGTSFGQYIVSPYVAASFYPVSDFMFAPILRYRQGVFPDPGVETIQKIDVQLRTVVNYGERYWTVLQPEASFDLSGFSHTVFPLRTEFGVMFRGAWGLSAMFTFYMAGEEKTRYFASLDFRRLF